MSTLDDQERQVITERFYKGRSQRNFGRDGSSQMYISRMEQNPRAIRRYLKKT